MRKDLDDKLVSSFPLLYADRHAPPQDTCMCWGFPGDGWYQLIYDLSAKIEAIIDRMSYKEERPRAMQVKEKFGGLRFYMTYTTGEIEGLIYAAEEASFHVCEQCGAPGQLVRGGWLYTSCKEHARPEHKAQFTA